MSLISSGVALFATNKVVQAFNQKKKVVSFINEASALDFCDDSFNEYLINNGLTIDTIKSFDNKTIEFFGKRINDSNNYILYVPSRYKSFNYYFSLINKFENNGFNTIYLSNINHTSFILKESLNLLLVINYLVKLNPNINLIVFGENDGANTIIKALESKLPNNVRCIIVDEVKPNYFNDLVKNYCIENKIKDTKLFQKNVYSKLENSKNITLNDISIQNSLLQNEIPICFVHNELLNDMSYYDLLKIYNKNKKNQKIFFTKTQGRNFLDKNYFNVIKKFILEHVE